MLQTDGQVRRMPSFRKHYPSFFADNVFSVKSWCKSKFGLEDSAIDRQFSIPEDFDYIN